QALLSGGTLYPIESFFPKDVARLIEHERVTGLPGVPFMYQLLADLEEKHDLSSLRFAISAGAPLPVETAAAFAQAYGVVVRSLYGSTETGVISIVPDAAGENGDVGVPVPGVAVSIVNDAGMPVPDGEEGRVRIVSPFAAQRYD